MLRAKANQNSHPRRRCNHCTKVPTHAPQYDWYACNFVRCTHCTRVPTHAPTSCVVLHFPEHAFGGRLRRHACGCAGAAAAFGGRLRRHACGCAGAAAAFGGRLRRHASGCAGADAAFGGRLCSLNLHVSVVHLYSSEFPMQGFVLSCLFVSEHGSTCAAELPTSSMADAKSSERSRFIASTIMPICRPFVPGKKSPCTPGAVSF